MTNIHVHPFIFFKGECREAMTFYQGILGGELTLRTFSEVGGETPEGWDDKIAYAELKADGLCLKAWDSPMANPEARKIEFEVIGTNEAALRKIFDALSEGEGKAKHPMEMQSWGRVSGRLFDKYGLDWMVTVAG